MTVLELDPNIRNWVLVPIVVLTVLVGLARHVVMKLMQSDSASTLDRLRQINTLTRAQRLRANGGFISRKGFASRKQYFIEPTAGVLCQRERAAMANPLANPNMMTDMMKGNFAVMIPNVVMMGWISYFFSGFVLAKIPFPLTSRFKMISQRGIELSTLDVSYVSSLSWYILVMFGTRGLFALLLGGGHDTDELKLQQMQMGMAPAGPQQFDPNAAMKQVGEAERRLLAAS